MINNYGNILPESPEGMDGSRVFKSALLIRHSIYALLSIPFYVC